MADSDGAAIVLLLIAAAAIAARVTTPAAPAPMTPQPPAPGGGGGSSPPATSTTPPYYPPYTPAPYYPPYVPPVPTAPPSFDPSGAGPPPTGTAPATAVSPAGRAFIRQEEGLRLTAYPDGTTGYAIGYGHFIQPGDAIATPGGTITQAQANALFATDITSVEAVLHQDVSVALTQNEFDALASLVYNIGSGTFASSPVRTALNAGDYQGAVEAFDNYATYGRTGRRLREQAMFTNAASG